MARTTPGQNLRPCWPAPQANGRRNIGCGWWPIGSDADRDLAVRRGEAASD